METTEIKEEKCEKTVDEKGINCDLLENNNYLINNNIENNFNNNNNNNNNNKTNGELILSDLELIENLRQENTRIRQMIGSLEVIKDKLIVIIDECQCSTKLKGRQEIFELIANYNQLKINDFEVAAKLTVKSINNSNRPKRKYKKRKFKLQSISQTGKKRGRPRKLINQLVNNVIVFTSFLFVFIIHLFLTFT
jgi:hypothetical protein